MPTPLATPWPSGPVVTSTPAVWLCSGWPGVRLPPLPETSEVVQGQAVAGEVQHGVEQDRGVAVGQDEAVPVGPVGVGRVVVHDPGEQHVGQWGEGHGRAASGRSWRPGGVHGQAPDDVDAQLLEGEGVGLVPGEWCWRSSTATLPAASSDGPRGRRASARLRAPGHRRPEQGDRRGELVDEVAAPDRSELAGGEEPAHRHRAQGTGQRPGVVVGLVEQPGPPAAAGEQQAAVGPATVQAGAGRGAAVTASRWWKRTVLPSGTRSSTATAPVDRSTPTTLRSR